MTVVDFYNGLGIDGLSNILDEESNIAYYDYIKTNLVEGNILDAGCGYGRLSTPLLNEGYDVTGLDIMPNFIEFVSKQQTKGQFLVGDILNLPFDENSFSNIICMWSTFNHFLTDEDQKKALLNFYKILKPGGQAILDLPTPEIYETPTFQRIKTVSPSKHICNYTINGNPNSDFVHNEETLTRICEIAGIDNFKVARENIGKLPRLILRLFK